jgi:hypothetical protein
MLTVKQNSHMFELAKRGAEVRLRELAQELKVLVRAFPHLRDSFDKDELPLPFIIARDAGRATTTTRPVRRQRTMSAPARRAASQRMKKYWAARRKEAHA